jgi:hypothetical protein
LLLASKQSLEHYSKARLRAIQKLTSTPDRYDCAQPRRPSADMPLSWLKHAPVTGGATREDGIKTCPSN